MFSLLKCECINYTTNTRWCVYSFKDRERFAIGCQFARSKVLKIAKYSYNKRIPGNTQFGCADLVDVDVALLLLFGEEGTACKQMTSNADCQNNYPPSDHEYFSLLIYRNLVASIFVVALLFFVVFLNFSCYICMPSEKQLYGLMQVYDNDCSIFTSSLPIQTYLHIHIYVHTLVIIYICI